MGQKYLCMYRAIMWLLQKRRKKGVRADYKPWYTVRDVPSTGTRRREAGVKTLRKHHLMSDLEREFHLMCEWNPAVDNYREQHPHLDLEAIFIKRSITDPSCSGGRYGTETRTDA